MKPTGLSTVFVDKIQNLSIKQDVTISHAFHTSKPLMIKTENNAKSSYLNKKRRGISRACLIASFILVGINLMIWLIVFLPNYLADLSASLENWLKLFIGGNGLGVTLASIAFLRRRRLKEISLYAVIANVVMILMNASLLKND